MSKWDVSYKKGLAALTDSEYAEIIRNPRLYYYDMTDSSDDKLNVWFGGDSSLRKKALLEAGNAKREYKEGKVTRKQVKSLF